MAVLFSPDEDNQLVWESRLTAQEAAGKGLGAEALGCRQL